MEALLHPPLTFKHSVSQVCEHHQFCKVQQVSSFQEVDYQASGVREVITCCRQVIYINASVIL